MVRSSNHIEIRVPAGNFGFVDVSVASQMFPDEHNTLASGYFYANKESGGIDLSINQLNEKLYLLDHQQRETVFLFINFLLSKKTINKSNNKQVLYY